MAVCANGAILAPLAVIDRIRLLKRDGLVTWGLYVLPSSRLYRRVQVLIDATYSYDIDNDDKLTGTSQTSKLHFYFCLLSMPNPANPNGPAIPTTTNPVDAYARLVSTRLGHDLRGPDLCPRDVLAPQSAFSMPVTVCVPSWTATCACQHPAGTLTRASPC